MPSLAKDRPVLPQKMPATGTQASTAGITIDRVAAGKLVEGWGLFDQLGLLQQIGAVAVPTRV